MKLILQVAKYTFKDVYRSKIIFGLLILSLLVFFISYVASEFAYGAEGKVGLDFGLGILSLSNIAIAIFLGSTLLQKEIDNKTLYMVLSRPIKRGSFVIGKMLGLSSILFINTILMVATSLLVFKFLGGSFQSLVIWCGLFSLLEGIVLMSYAVLFSQISNVTLSVFFTIIMALVGHNINETTGLGMVKRNTALVTFLKKISILVPDLERFNLKDFVLYKQSLEANYYINNIMYFIFFTFVLVLISIAIFEKKNLD